MPKYANLIEPNTKYVMKNLLQHCHEWKSQYYNRIMNATLWIVFSVLLCSVLYYCKKTKQSSVNNKKIHERHKKEHTLQTLQNLNQINQKVQSERISNIPFDTTFNLDNKIFI